MRSRGPPFFHDAVGLESRCAAQGTETRPCRRFDAESPVPCGFAFCREMAGKFVVGDIRNCMRRSDGKVRFLSPLLRRTETRPCSSVSTGTTGRELLALSSCSALQLQWDPPVDGIDPTSPVAVRAVSLAWCGSIHPVVPPPHTASSAPPHFRRKTSSRMYA